MFGRHQADRSPCGTGTSAKLAVLYKRGEIGIGEPFIYESFTGTTFKGTIRDVFVRKEQVMIIPEITGSAYITGTAVYLIDRNDPLKYGFLIGE